MTDNGRLALTLSAAALGAVLASVVTYLLVSGATGVPRAPASAAADTQDLAELSDRIGELIAALEKREFDGERLVQPTEPSTREPVSTDAGNEALIQAILAMRQALERIGSGIGLQPSAVPGSVTFNGKSLMQRPGDSSAFARVVEMYPELIKRDHQVPLPIAFMGAKEIIDYFGWPDSAEIPSGDGGSYLFTYEASLTGSPFLRAEIVSSENRTAYFHFDLAE